MIPPALMEKRTRRRTGWTVGAIRLGLADVITALIVLALLLWASWWQFPAYQHKFAPGGGVRARATPAASVPRATYQRGAPTPDSERGSQTRAALH